MVPLKEPFVTVLKEEPKSGATKPGQGPIAKDFCHGHVKMIFSDHLFQAFTYKVLGVWV